MEKRIVINSEIEDVRFSIYRENDIEEIGEDISYKDAAKELDCSEALLEMLADNFNSLVYCVHEDLVDLYNRTT